MFIINIYLFQSCFKFFKLFLNLKQYFINYTIYYNLFIFIKKIDLIFKNYVQFNDLKPVLSYKN